MTAQPARSTRIQRIARTVGVALLTAPAVLSVGVADVAAASSAPASATPASARWS